MPNNLRSTLALRASTGKGWELWRCAINKTQPLKFSDDWRRQRMIATHEIQRLRRGRRHAISIRPAWAVHRRAAPCHGDQSIEGDRCRPFGAVPDQPPKPRGLEETAAGVAKAVAGNAGTGPAPGARSVESANDRTAAARWLPHRKDRFS